MVLLTKEDYLNERVIFIANRAENIVWPFSQKQEKKNFFYGRGWVACAALLSNDNRGGKPVGQPGSIITQFLINSCEIALLVLNRTGI